MHSKWVVPARICQMLGVWIIEAFVYSSGSTEQMYTKRIALMSVPGGGTAMDDDAATTELPHEVCGAAA